jgi:hypothetical protein
LCRRLRSRRGRIISRLVATVTKSCTYL